MLTIAVSNQKVGVANTNLAGNLAAEFGTLGHRVLVVDIDPQATLTTWMLGRSEIPGTAEVLLGDAEADVVSVDVPAFDVRLLSAVPDRLRVAERTLSSRLGSERILTKALRNSPLILF